MNSNELRALVKECVLEVLQESLLEGFDPLSQGPNMVDPSGETNPYPIWNSKMRKLEEDDVAEPDFSIDSNGWTYRDRFIVQQKSEGKSNIEIAKQLFPHLWTQESLSNVKHNRWRKNVASNIGALYKKAMIKKQKRHGVQENEHGRYAQEAGAGQFDPRTFGKM